MSYTEADYLRWDPFEGDRDENVTLRTVKMVTTRKPQKCMDPEAGSLHPIPPGTRARYEQALVDGDYWGRYYVCVACMDKWLHTFMPKPLTVGGEK